MAFLVGLEHGVRTVGSELLVGDDELVTSEPYGTTEAQPKTIRLSVRNFECGPVAFLVGLEHEFRTVGSELIVGDDGKNE